MALQHHSHRPPRHVRSRPARPIFSCCQTPPPALTPHAMPKPKHTEPQTETQAPIQSPCTTDDTGRTGARECYAGRRALVLRPGFNFKPRRASRRISFTAKPPSELPTQVVATTKGSNDGRVGVPLPTVRRAVPFMSSPALPAALALSQSPSNVPDLGR